MTRGVRVPDTAYRPEDWPDSEPASPVSAQAASSVVDSLADAVADFVGADSWGLCFSCVELLLLRNILL